MKRGRPATGRDPVLSIRLDADQIAFFDAQAAERGMTRTAFLKLMFDRINTHIENDTPVGKELMKRVDKKLAQEKPQEK